MNRAIVFVKENPWKITLGTIITVCVTVGSFYFTDMRYVKKSEYIASQELLQQMIHDAIEKHKEEMKGMEK